MHEVRRPQICLCWLVISEGYRQLAGAILLVLCLSIHDQAKTRHR